jgi:hypothetical protein
MLAELVVLGVAVEELVQLVQLLQVQPIQAVAQGAVV